MTRYQFRVHSANVLFTILVFAVMAFGAVERWALTFVEVSIMLLALVWVVRRAFRPFPLEGNVFAWPLIGIVLMAVLQSVMGWSAAPYQTSGEALKWTALLAYFLMWAHVFRDESTRSRFSLLLTWFGFLVAVLALVQFYSAGFASASLVSSSTHRTTIRTFRGSQSLRGPDGAGTAWCPAVCF